MVLKVRERTFKRDRKDEEPAHGGIAQLVEHLLCKQGVIGSNPFTSTTQSRVVLKRDPGNKTRAHSSAG